MDHDEGLRLWVELALRDGFRPAGHHVAHVIVGDFGGAQRELGDDVRVVGDPFSAGGGGDVCCKNTETETHSGSLGLQSMTGMFQDCCQAGFSQ